MVDLPPSSPFWTARNKLPTPPAAGSTGRLFPGSAGADLDPLFDFAPGAVDAGCGSLNGSSLTAVAAAFDGSESNGFFSSVAGAFSGVLSLSLLSGGAALLSAGLANGFSSAGLAADAFVIGPLPTDGNSVGYPRNTSCSAAARSS